MCCCLSYKDTILKANHSIDSYQQLYGMAVAYPTKILFWKRITANRPGRIPILCCCLSYKDTILKANHSAIRVRTFSGNAVAYPTKILFWKRITATTDMVSELFALLLILQRYYFESESQRCATTPSTQNSCCLSYKDTILKANHSVVYNFLH